MFASVAVFLLVARAEKVTSRFDVRQKCANHERADSYRDLARDTVRTEQTTTRPLEHDGGRTRYDGQELETGFVPTSSGR